MTRTYTVGFSGGVMSPGMFGLIADAEFRRGLEQCRNAAILPQGGVRRRGGTRISAPIKNSAHRARVERFRFSDDQALLVEMGHGYIRLHEDGAPVAAIPRAYTASATVTFSATTPGVVTWPSAHNLIDGDPVQFTGGTPPTEVVLGTTYYADVSSPTTIRLRTTPTGTSLLPFSGTGSGTTTGHRLYELGYVVVSGGVNYYCIQQHTNITPPNATFWYAMPASGVLEIPVTRFADDNLFEITIAQSNDVMTFAHRSFEPLELRRYSTARWVAASVVFSPSLAAPTGLAIVSDPGITQDISTITAPSGPGTELQFNTNSPHALSQGLSTILIGPGTGGSTVYIPHGLYRVGKVIDPFAFWLCRMDGGNNIKTPDSAIYPGAYSGLTMGFIDVNPTAEQSHRYAVTAVNADGIESTPSAFVTAANNLDTQGAKNTLTWDPVVGARRYYIYREDSGFFGFVGQVDADPATGFASGAFVDDQINPDTSRTFPTFDQSLGTTEHPGAVGYYQGRRWFAATENQPQDVWATRSGTESDLSFHIPVSDSDRVYFRAALRELAIVRHIVPASQLLLMTSSGEMRVAPRSGVVLTPSDIDVRPQSFVGCSYVQPQLYGPWVVFVAERGSGVWTTTYELTSETFVPIEVSVRARHLFSGRVLVDSAQSRLPSPTLWFVSDDGRLLGCTFMPEQNVRGWFVFDTQGSFESVAVVPEGAEDRVYAVVLRDGVRYVERMEPVADATRAEGLFLDAAATITSGSSIPVVHPNGTVVDALIDGVVYRDLVVAGGAVALPVAATSRAWVGLRYQTDITTLPLALSIDAYAQGRQLNVNRVTPRIRESAPCLIGAPGASFAPLMPDVAGTLQSGFRSQLAHPSWQNTGQCTFLCTDPLPFEMTSLTIEVAIGGE